MCDGSTDDLSTCSIRGQSYYTRIAVPTARGLYSQWGWGEAPLYFTPPSLADLLASSGGTEEDAKNKSRGNDDNNDDGDIMVHCDLMLPNYSF